jgi:hypothetical protein
MPSAADPAPLNERLGTERASAVRWLMQARMADWALAIDHDAVHAPEPDESAAAAAARVFEAHGGGWLLIAWPALPRWRPEHAAAAIGDLQAGAGLSVGPVFDGGFYLLAMARPIPVVLDALDGPDTMNRALLAGHEQSLEVGLLRAERGLNTAADVAAALADPLLDPELRDLLR